MPHGLADGMVFRALTRGYDVVLYAMSRLVLRPSGRAKHMGVVSGSQQARTLFISDTPTYELGRTAEDLADIGMTRLLFRFKLSGLSSRRHVVPIRRSAIRLVNAC